MATESATAPCPARPNLWPVTSRGAAATTRRPSTANARAITSTTWTAWRGSSRRPATKVPKPVIQGNGQARGGHHRLRHKPLGGAREPSINSRKSRTSKPAIAACGLTRSPTEVHDFIRRHDRVYVVDQNRDAQMLSLFRLELEPEEIKKLRSVRHYDGLPIDARSITNEIVSQEAQN